ncbi:MAG TPA: sigma-70 family RNA polymerase sigma factor, partial [candidate division Zixibacteria bacterium]|nr:sigma-70 family RNA polymerase sigma factor [candidate division Zixibacteria bacterium]
QNTRLALLSCFREGKYRGEGLTTYVRRIAAIQSLLEMRRHYRLEKYRAEWSEQTQDQPDTTENPLSTIVGRERKEMAMKVLKTLGKLCRQLLLLKFYKGLRYSELGARLGLTEVNARVSTHRCLQKSKEISRKMEKGL